MRDAGMWEHAIALLGDMKDVLVTPNDVSCWVSIFLVPVSSSDLGIPVSMFISSSACKPGKTQCQKPST